MNVIRRIPEGAAIPDNHRIVQVLATEDVQEGTGANTLRWYTVVLSDDRYWLPDNEKLADPQFPSRAALETQAT